MRNRLTNRIAENAASSTENDWNISTDLGSARVSRAVFGVPPNTSAPNRSSALRKSSVRLHYAFTLVELILVMALLVVAASLLTPKLAQFFGGRKLDSELQRFVSLAHYGQSRAVSEGIPTVLWVDAKAGTYGLKQETGYIAGTAGDPKAVDYTVGDGLTVSVDKGTAKSPLPGKAMGIHFSPDGTVVTATSVAGVSFQETGRTPIWVRPAANGMNYEVKN